MKRTIQPRKSVSHRATPRKLMENVFEIGEKKRKKKTGRFPGSCFRTVFHRSWIKQIPSDLGIHKIVSALLSNFSNKLRAKQGTYVRTYVRCVKRDRFAEAENAKRSDRTKLQEEGYIFRSSESPGWKRYFWYFREEGENREREYLR